MVVQVSYPGVYVQEVPSGVRTIVGVSTSTTVFIGRARQGPLNRPVRCLNFTDYERAFSADTSVGEMTRYLKLFFLNGGTDCYAMRIANGAGQATVTLQTEAGAPSILLTSKQAGAIGETLRAAVTYAGQQPEATFNLELFRWETNASGLRVALDAELWQNLSMNPNSPLFAPSFLTQNSKLVDAMAAAGAPAAVNGFSQSGRPVAYNNATPSTLRTELQNLVGTGAGATANRFEISVDGRRYVPVDLGNIDVGAMTVASLNALRTAFSDAVAAAVGAALTAAGFPGVTVAASLVDGPAPPAAAAPVNATVLLRITSANAGDIFIRPSTAGADAAVPLMLGTLQGGLEVGAHAARRPAPTGITLQGADPAALIALAALEQGAINQVTVAGTAIAVALQTTANAADRWYQDGNAATGNSSGLREKLGLIRDAINAARAADPRNFLWRADLWGSRLAILPTNGDDNAIGTIATAATNIANRFTRNVRYASVGASGTAGLQTPAAGPASDGTPPLASDYDDAYETIDRDVDIFNLMVLPPDAAVPNTDLWGPASVFCQRRRAFLLMDPLDAWTDAQTASTGVDALRVGLVRDYSALFYPRVTINEDGLRRNVGPSGAIAGLMARIDGSRGVWKAPAGTEADLRGVVGLQYLFSDQENGILNPRAINTLRVFPNGVVNWGARTMDGDNDFASEWKYIPIRRLALYIEESLYRGLKWVVFEPNDEPLWAQIRLNVGAFMHDLFRQGAFQGQKPADAYFVRCDAETTTQTDRNLGIVNIWVGFAPLKPAEFVVLYLQQMAGQIEV